MNFLLVCISLSLICSAYAENFTYTNANETHFQSDNELSNSDRQISGTCDVGYLRVAINSDDGCYLPYKQGPCPPGHYVHLPINKTVVECVANNCLIDGLVPYNGTCQRTGLWEIGPCNVGGLVIDPETFQPKCIDEVVRPLSVASQLSCSGNRYLKTLNSQDVGSWKCECRETGHVYFPLKNECHEPYRQGPCEIGSYFHPPIGETEAQCVVNPCIEDGLVPYNDSCYKLAIWDEGPCEFGGLLADPITLQLKCFNEIELSKIPWSPESLIRCSEPTYLKKFRSDPRDWRCRCQERNKLYLPSYDSCYDAYKQGPCESGEYVQLAVNETVAKCAMNPCPEDDMAFYNGTCYKIGLWGEGPCDIGGLVIDQETFQPKCIDEIPDPHSSRDDMKCTGGRVLYSDNSLHPRDWKCQCKQPDLIYFPLKNGCYELYRQGPCPSGHYVYLAINETVPQCVVNNCSQDGLVSYNGTCHKYAVWGEGPCIIGGLLADPTTSQLKCVGEISDLSAVKRLMKCPNNLVLYRSWSNNSKDWFCGCRLYFQFYSVFHNACVNLPENACFHQVYFGSPIMGMLSGCNQYSSDILSFGSNSQVIGSIIGLGGRNPYVTNIPEFCPLNSQRDQNGSCRPVLY